MVVAGEREVGGLAGGHVMFVRLTMAGQPPGGDLTPISISTVLPATVETGETKGLHDNTIMTLYRQRTASARVREWDTINEAK